MYDVVAVGFGTVFFRIVSSMAMLRKVKFSSVEG